MTLSELRDLSDDELHSRLYNRGVNRPTPMSMVHRREEPAVEKLILAVLNGQPVRRCIR